MFNTQQESDGRFVVAVSGFFSCVVFCTLSLPWRENRRLGRCHVVSWWCDDDWRSEVMMDDIDRRLIQPRDDCPYHISQAGWRWWCPWFLLLAFSSASLSSLFNLSLLLSGGCLRDSKNFDRCQCFSWMPTILCLSVFCWLLLEEEYRRMSITSYCSQLTQIDPTSSCDLCRLQPLVSRQGNCVEFFWTYVPLNSKLGLNRTCERTGRVPFVGRSARMWKKSIAGV